MKVCLVIPKAPFLIDEMVIPPLGILYVAAVLREAGHEVVVNHYEPLPGFDLYGFTATSATFPYAIEAMEMLSKMGTAAPAVVGGPHATVSPLECLDAGFDAVVVGEGERSILRVVGGERGIIREPFIEDLDAVPFPARDLVDIHSYRYEIAGRPALSVITSRGCPYECTFCAKTWGRRIRFRSAENVLAEVEANREGFGAIYFPDDEMLVNLERDTKIFQGLARMGMPYRCFTRSNLVNDSVAGMLAETGCWEVLVGIESGSDLVLGKIRKGTTREMNLRAVRTLKRHGIRVKGTFIVGLPGESRETIQETDSFCEEAGLNDVDFTVLAVYPGSAIMNGDRHDLFIESPWQSHFKGKPGEYVVGARTAALSREEILEARDRLEAKYKRWS